MRKRGGAGSSAELQRNSILANWGDLALCSGVYLWVRYYLFMRKGKGGGAEAEPPVKISETKTNLNNKKFLLYRSSQGTNARKVISEVYEFFVLQCTVFGWKSKHKTDVTA